MFAYFSLAQGLIDGGAFVCILDQNLKYWHQLENSVMETNVLIEIISTVIF